MQRQFRIKRFDFFSEHGVLQDKRMYACSSAFSDGAQQRAYFIVLNQRIDGDVNLDVEQFGVTHAVRKLFDCEIPRIFPGGKVLQSEVDCVCTAVDGGTETFPISGRR